MAQLFGTGTIKSHTDILAGRDESKISLIQDIYQDYKNGLLTDEVKYKEKFNKVFFGDLLGYEDRIHRIPEGTIFGTGNADLIFGNFEDGKENAENIQVVCELKGAKSSLVKKQFGHGGLSPVGQGFAYKTALKNCKWLIVSNFYEIRLYRDNQTDFEEWNLQMLMDPKDDYFNLRKLYLLLHKNNLLSSTGNSKTENLLSHFREEQKEITAKFYKEYKILRVELINDMKQNNPGVSVEILIEKAQKIIDRLIFIFFCEDKGLLPDKKLSENILRSREAGFSAWEVTKKFFGLVDKGSEQLGIPNGYNGGLFQKDDVLDSIEIADHICKKFVDLTNYDFDDKLSVNVLGHIFEQSISDLENLKIDLLGTEIETEQLADTGKGRRKKDGIFYTPEYIVDYIVQNSVMKYLNEKEDECLLKHKNKKDGEKLAYQEYQHILQNIKVLDPACGSGAFLVRVFDVLFEENRRIGSILNSLFDETETYKNILTNNIYGVDLNEESVEITKLSLRLKSAQKGKKLNNLDGNIKCGNSLIDDPDVSGEKAFDWNKNFPDILPKTTIFIDNLREIKKEELLNKTSINGLEFVGFNIDGLFNLRNDKSLSELHLDKTSALNHSKAGKGITEHIPQIFGNDFDTLQLSDTPHLPYSKLGEIQTGSKGVIQSWSDDLVLEFNKIKNTLLDILGKELINKHFKDFLVLINSIMEFYTMPGTPYQITEKAIYSGININTKRYKNILVTDDVHGIFAQNFREEILEKLQFKIIKSSESINVKSPKYYGFDVIVGNPPYGAKFATDEFKFFNKKFETSEYKIDTYVLFMEKGNHLLKKGGALGFIVPYTFTSGKFFTKIRNFLKQNMKIEKLILLGKGIFDEADVDTLIFLGSKCKNDGRFSFQNLKNIETDVKQNILLQGKLEVGSINHEGGKEIILGGGSLFDLLSKLDQNSKLEKIVEFYHGVQTRGDDKAISNKKEGDTYLPLIKGKDFNRYSLTPEKKYINFIKDNIKSGGDIEKYLVPEKLIMRTTGDLFVTTYDIYKYICLNSVNLILPKDAKFSLKYILCFLNSSLLKFWYHAIVGEEGKTFAEVKISYLKNVPIKEIPLSEQQPFIERADKMLALNKELHELGDKFFHRIQDNLKIEKLTKKLENFYEGDFKDFLAELKKQKASLSLAQQDEWEPYFKEYREKVLAVKGEIERTDKEIDEMVYKLYGLTEEEVKVVEGK